MLPLVILILGNVGYLP